MSTANRFRYGQAMRQRIWERDGARCWSCQRSVSLEHMSLDHIIPRSRGGRDAETNLRCACWACNQYRGDVVTKADIEHARRLEATK